MSTLSKVCFLLATASIVTACMAGDPGSGPAKGPGSSNGGPDAGAPAAADCLLKSDYGDLGSLSMGSAVVVPQNMAQPTGPQILLFNVAVGAPGAPGAPQDILHVELWQGQGAFAAGFKPGSYPISGTETDFFTCSTCVMVAADFDTTTSTPKKLYMAKGGTLTLTAIDPTAGTGKLTGTLSGLTFGDVDVSGQTQVALTDGCSTAVSKLAFDLAVAAPK